MTCQKSDSIGHKSCYKKRITIHVLIHRRENKQDYSWLKKKSITQKNIFFLLFLSFLGVGGGLEGRNNKRGEKNSFRKAVINHSTEKYWKSGENES